MSWSIFRQGGGNGAAVTWAEQMLKALGAPLTQSNINFVYNWERAEGAGGAYNPLNQGPVPGQPGLSGGTQYGGGASDYRSWSAGITGAVAYLNMSNYRAVKNALMSGNGAAARSALIASPWAANHYHNGASFGTVAAPRASSIPGFANGLNLNTSVGGATNINAPGATGNVTPRLNMADLQARYGFTAAMLNADSSLKQLFNQAVSQQWSDAVFQAHLMGTNWWRSQTDTQRQFWLKKFTDPRTAQAQWSGQQATVNNIASQYGVSMFRNEAMLKMVNYVTDATIKNSWNEAQIRNYFATHVADLHGTGLDAHYGGQLGQWQDQIGQFTWQNGIFTTQYGMSKYVEAMAKGNMSMEQVQADIRAKAAAKFSPWKSEIMAGQNVMDLVNPYMQSMSKILELDPGSFDLFDNSFVKNVMQKDQSGKTVATPMWQFEENMRQDPRWLKTTNARDSVQHIAHGVLQDMGFSY